MSFHPRRVLKRKEREALLCQAKPSVTKPVDSFPSNQLLARYMAHEFLTRGTLFGEQFHPAKSSAEWKRTKPEAEPCLMNEHGCYAELATILKINGTHIPGIVNPTQLTRWIQM